jgi:hypothetical protein
MGHHSEYGYETGTCFSLIRGGYKKKKKKKKF